MNQKKHLILPLAAFFAAASILQGQALAEDNFDTYSTGADLETQSSQAWRSNQAKSFDVAATGIGGSQAAEWDSTTNVSFGGYTFQTFFGEPSVGESVTTSLDFRFSLDAGATANRNTVVLGFSESSLASFRLNAQLQRLSSNNSWRLKSSGGGTQAAVSSADMGVASETSGTSNWLRIETQVTKLATQDEFSQTITLYDLGTNGLDTPTIIQSVASQTFTDANLYGAATWHGFFVGDRPADIGMSALSYDNFSVIPEPSHTVGLIGFLTCGVLLFRRSGATRQR